MTDYGVRITVSAGAVYCDRCGWGHEGGTEDERWVAFVAHECRPTNYREDWPE